jgi:transcription antitermination factor NusG
MELSHSSFGMGQMGQTEYISPMTAELQLDTETKWHAVYTSANHEKRVREQLEQRSVESFLPMYESVRRWKDRRTRLNLPLFPGYVFVRMPSRDRLKVLQVPGVAHLVGFGGQLTPVPEEDIQAIRACLAGPNRAQPHHYLKSGQQVRVLNGPLAGLTGIVVREKKQARFVISFDLLQRSVAVEIDAADLGPDGSTRG